MKTERSRPEQIEHIEKMKSETKNFQHLKFNYPTMDKRQLDFVEQAIPKQKKLEQP